MTEQFRIMTPQDVHMHMEPREVHKLVNGTMERVYGPPNTCDAWISLAKKDPTKTVALFQASASIMYAHNIRIFKYV
jgi:hypothetical protein